MGKQFLPRYLKSLCEILTKEVSVGSLLSIVETDAFYAQVDYGKKPRFAWTILFSERNRVGELLKKHAVDFDERYVLWIKDSMQCGAVEIESLDYFNFEFPYEVSKNGIITLTQVNYKYQILLDFYEENDVRYLDIKLFYEMKKA